MKTLIALIASAFITLTATACDGPLFRNYTIQPGQTLVDIWDFSDCYSGINDFGLYLSKQNVAGGLPNGTRLTMQAIDLTTGQVVNQEGTAFLVKFFGGRVCGHVIQLTIISTSKKSIPITVNPIGVWGGPCQ